VILASRERQASHLRQSLSFVAAATDHATLETGKQFLDVRICDFLERQIQFGAQLRQIPEHIAEFAFERLPILFGDHTIFVTENLLDFAREFARLVDQPERWVGDRMIAADRLRGFA
jgi:hypothetical protein